MSDEAKKIRVFLLVTSTAGGTGRHVYYLTQMFSREEFDLTVGFGPGYPLDEEIKKLGVPVHEFSISRKINPFKNLRGFFQLLFFMRRNKVDAICMENSIAGFIGRIAAWMAGVPVRVFIIQSFASHPHQPRIKQKIYRFIEKQLDRLTCRYVAVADAMKRFGVNSGIMSNDKVTVIYNGIPTPEPVKTGREEICRELGIDPENKIVGTLARFEPQKGLHYLFEAAALVRQTRQDVVYMIAGDGPLRGELEEQVEKLGLDGTVRFIGWRKDCEAILNCMDIFCMPSLWEAMPFTLIEAMAMGKPIVASNIDGNPEVIVDGQTGILVPSADSAALAAGLLKILDDPEQMKAIGQAGRERYHQHFTAEIMVERFEDLIKELVLTA
jgi:glycosyltransferase involved in cell wall biosynthesis